MERRGSGSPQERQPHGWWQQYLAWSETAKKKTAAVQPKPRVRLTLLVLLWIWAALMFVVVDLFIDVPAFDRARPRAPFYDAMRQTAHELAGRPLHDGSALAVPGFRAEALPSPPAEFRGTQLQWRVKRNDLDEAEMATALRSLGSLDQRERLAVLRRVRLKPDVALAQALIEAADELPADPIACAYYSAASLSVLRALVEHESASQTTPHDGSRHDPRAAVLQSQVGRELLEKGLGAEVRRAVEHGQELDGQAWAGVLAALEEFEGSFPDLRHRGNCAQALARIEVAVCAELREALEPRPGYRGGVGAIRLAAWIGSPTLLELLLRLFAEHEILAKKLPAPRQENELVALDEIVRCIAAKGSAASRADLARLLAEELGWQQDENVRKRLWRYASVLVRSPGIDVGSIRTLASAQARGDFELSYRDAIRQAGVDVERRDGGR